jgi:hypothetical protein
VNRYRMILAACVSCGLASFPMLSGIENVVLAQPAIGNAATGDKDITVLASSAAEPSAKAKAQNLGWTVVSVKKAS